MKITKLSCKGRKLGEQRVITKFAYLPTSARQSEYIALFERVSILQTVTVCPWDTGRNQWTNEFFV